MLIYVYYSLSYFTSCCLVVLSKNRLQCRAFRIWYWKEPIFLIGAENVFLLYFNIIGYRQNNSSGRQEDFLDLKTRKISVFFFFLTFAVLKCNNPFHLLVYIFSSETLSISCCLFCSSIKKQLWSHSVDPDQPLHS